MKQTFEDNFKPMFSEADIYNSLYDEESRRIFQWRCRANEAKSVSAELAEAFFNDDIYWVISYKQLPFIIKQHDCAIKEDTLLSRIRNNADEVILYGAGIMCKPLLLALEELDIGIRNVCDSFKVNQNVCGHKILSLDDALSSANDLPIIITSVKTQYRSEIYNDLISRGISCSQVFALEWIEENYFSCHDIISSQINEVYVDVGCFDGGTILAFREFAGESGYKHIFGYEPSPESYEKTLDAISENEVLRVTILKKGLWDSKDRLYFTDLSGDSNKISENGEISIETAILDDDAAAHGEKVTLIKMDIEGAELNALRGAKNIIRRDKPRLIISLYHKPEDLLNISSFILETNPDYKLYLRHLSPLPFGQTILYAV